MRVTWTNRARRDLAAIEEFIARDDPAAAASWIDGLFLAAERASKAPLAGRIVPEFRRDDLREVVRGNYRIVYLVLADAIEILTIFEGHRRMPLV